MKKLTLSLLILSISLFAREYITIGTGGITGTYYPTGGAICRLLNMIKKQTDVLCTIESTDGSVYNINSIVKGELDFGIVQSDIVYDALKGIEKFEGKDVPKLRAVMAIYPELFTLVSRKDANIKSIMDIKGKRINLGSPGSGNEATAEILFAALGIKKSELAYAGMSKVAEMPEELKDSRIDGYFYMVGHPTANIKITSDFVDVRLVPISGNKVDKLVEKYPYYTQDIIPANTYKGNSEDVSTFGVKAVLVTTSDTSDEIVYALVKQVLENFELFRKSHPAFLHITEESLLKGLSAPLHDGAKRYYKDAGLIK
ncbi:MAG: C4-dicarboxylate ABC transporter substrate-binding protein [Arcobacter sp.]|uniref:TAXI family TRAP transporter solute-binding subunit n=1 Tax=uncultured Arcobacter sp. TaxID=165434 RepID=UPI000CCB69C2|nr:TAXI family TRAP transporter solute-binding subunit [uncultured Arcobacter sp.]PLY10724.1 MAG: C4-dicarboxylate ABC transporter substrate-binding protein [Arcobacter sp.]